MVQSAVEVDGTAVLVSDMLAIFHSVFLFYLRKIKNYVENINCWMNFLVFIALRNFCGRITFFLSKLLNKFIKFCLQFVK